MQKEFNKKRVIFLSIGTVALIFLIYFFFLSDKQPKDEPTPVPPQTETKETSEKPTEPQIIKEEKPIPLPIGTDRFIVSLKDTNENIALNLFTQEYIKDQNTFTALLSGKDGKGVVLPGGYKISKEMNDAQLVQVLKGKAYMKWVVVPEGLRKEEIAELLANTLGWSKNKKDTWIKTDTATKPEYLEGVYFPDTYLMPVDEDTKTVANRFISKFNEKFYSYLPAFTAKNIKWTKALTLASIVQREAANNADTPLIAGILWNRLNQNMKLDVDATLQYIRGNVGSGWWASISLADKKTDSPFNTYMYTGLPPHPISNPGISAIEAVLNPTKTDCLYYLHDKDHVTHCAVTYEEHQANIEKYLKNN